MRANNKNMVCFRRAEASLNGLSEAAASPDQEDTDADDDESIYELDGGEE